MAEPLPLLALTIHSPKHFDAPCDAIRTWDCEVPQRWCDVEPRPGEFDLSGLKTLAGSGKRLLWVIGGVPAFYARDKTTDAYGSIGGASATTNLAALRRYVRTVWDAIGSSIALVEVGNEVQHDFDLWAAMYEAVYEELPEALVCAPSVDPAHPDYLAQLLKHFRRPPACIALHLYNWDCSERGLLSAIKKARELVGPNVQIAVTEMGLSPIYEAPGQLMPWRALSELQQGNAWQRCARIAAEERLFALAWYDWISPDGEARGVIYPMGSRPKFVRGMVRALSGS